MPPAAPATAQPFDTAPQHAWLIERGLAGAAVPELLDVFCRRLNTAGLPLARGYLSAAALHPLMWATGFRWHAGGTVEAVDIAHGFETDAAWLASPFRHMVESRTRRLHRRLAGAGSLLDFPVLAELRDTGLTEWLALFYSFGWPLKHADFEREAMYLVTLLKVFAMAASAALSALEEGSTSIWGQWAAKMS